MAFLLHHLFAPLRARVAHVSLGSYPTPVHAAPGLHGPRGEVWLKREDLASPVYGGNKIRTLELLFAVAAQRGAKRIWSTGAFGSNHALATALHAPRAGLDGAAMLFPQVYSDTAADNLRALVSVGAHLWALPTILAFPFGLWRLHRASRYGGARDAVMVPGGATALGALGHVAAGLEIANQVARGEMPEPRHVVLPVGSTCTTAGLMVGLALARRLGLAFGGGPPTVHAMRVTPFPVTAAFRIRALARRARELLGDALSARDLGDPREVPLRVDGHYLGRGYGQPTEGGRAAQARFAALDLAPLDTTYSAKAAAGLLRLRERVEGPILFWCTKSSAPLPPDVPERLSALPPRVRRWLSPAALG